MKKNTGLFTPAPFTMAELTGRATVPIKRIAEGRSERIALRNRALVARKYYWEEIMRRRSDDVTVILADHEFFVDERTIQNALLEYSEFYKELCKKRITSRQLQKMFPTWRF